MLTNIRKLFLRYRDDEDGSVAVEFGIISIGFITILFAIIECGRLFLTWNGFQYSMEKASRLAMVDTTVTQESLTTMVGNQIEVFLANSDNLVLTYNVTAPNANGIRFVELDGTYNYNTIVPFLPETWSTFQFQASSRLPRP